MMNEERDTGIYTLGNQLMREMDRMERLTVFIQDNQREKTLIDDYSKEMKQTVTSSKKLLSDLLNAAHFLEKRQGTAKKEETASLKKRNILLAVPPGQREKELEDILTKFGATVFLAKDGKKAVDAFQFARSETFDAVLIDVHMPKKNGFLVAKAIRSCEKENAEAIPLIALASHDEEENRRAMDAGMNGCLKEPYEEKEIMRLLHLLLKEKKGKAHK